MFEKHVILQWRVSITDAKSCVYAPVTVLIVTSSIVFALHCDGDELRCYLLMGEGVLTYA